MSPVNARILTGVLMLMAPGLRAETLPTEARAREIIQQAGYTDVRDLRQVENGWHAIARESGKEVSLILDPLGVRKEIPRGP